jgi:hypothetical protein
MQENILLILKKRSLAHRGQSVFPTVLTTEFSEVPLQKFTNTVAIHLLKELIMNTTLGTTEINDPARYAASSAWAGSASAVSWGAIFAGAAAAAALSLILLILGTGLGLGAISPWANDGIEAKTLGLSTIVWITLTSIVASGLGGYLAGRLRTKWASAQVDEVYFRDTAHGLLAWAVATLLTASLLTSAASSILGAGVKAGAAVAGGAVGSVGVAATVAGANADKLGLDNNSSSYFVDSLFRKPPTAAAAVTTPTTDLNGANNLPASEVPTAEVARIFANALRTNALPPADVQYLGQVIATHTGLTQQEAETRVKDTYNLWQTKLHEAEVATKKAADEARKSTAYISLWLFVSLLAGAFAASWLATFGGRQRDL